MVFVLDFQCRGGLVDYKCTGTRPASRITVQFWVSGQIFKLKRHLVHAVDIPFSDDVSKVSSTIHIFKEVVDIVGFSKFSRRNRNTYFQRIIVVRISI